MFSTFHICAGGECSQASAVVAVSSKPALLPHHRRSGKGLVSSSRLHFMHLTANIPASGSNIPHRLVLCQYGPC
jgi:hypothetical protein